jgi:hypothetical protein
MRGTTKIAVVVAAVVVLGAAVGITYWLTRPKEPGFTEAQIEGVKKYIRTKIMTPESVREVAMVRESPRKLTGYVKYAPTAHLKDGAVMEDAETATSLCTAIMSDIPNGKTHDYDVQINCATPGKNE